LLSCQLPDGSEIPLPPILLGKLGSDPQKKTVCVYGHLDVQPAALEDGWDSEPFTLVERDGEDGASQRLLAVPEEKSHLFWYWSLNSGSHTR
jgi:acetylornithine deacetylase/succinyl-diaminopimelate desuccinylase-like protein